jgi:2'-5' RNA ligase
MPLVRAFIAIELPPEIQDPIARLQARVRQDLPPGLVRWVRPEGIHLTLKFLGDVDQDDLPLVKERMREACVPHAPFTLTVGGLGCFPNLRRPRVVWVGLDDSYAALSALQRGLERAIAPLGFPTERRRFHPHLTLGRVKNGRSRAELEVLGAYVTRAKVDIGQMSVEAVRLMRSELLPGGAVYSELACCPLDAHG